MIDSLEIHLIATLRRLGGAPVHQLADELGAGPRLVEALLRDLRRRGQVRCAEQGSPPVVFWRVQ